MPFICKNMCSRKIGVGKTCEQKLIPYKKASHEVPTNWNMPFLSHGRCRTCQAWQNKDIGLKCICCGSKISIKPRLNKNKRKYNGC